MKNTSDEELRRLKQSAEEFDKAHALFLADPDEFHRRARQRIEVEICKADPSLQIKLRRLQFQIDAKLSRHTNPQMRLNEMIILFWEGVHRFNSALRGELKPIDTNVNAKILPFEPRKQT